MVDHPGLGTSLADASGSAEPGDPWWMGKGWILTIKNDTIILGILGFHEISAGFVDEIVYAYTFIYIYIHIYIYMNVCAHIYI